MPTVTENLGRKAGVSILFASSIVPLLLVVGLSVDYSFYGEAQAQLNMAADSAALHAVRVAIQAEQAQQANFLAQGIAAGQAWFTAQEGSVPQLQANSILPKVTVTNNTTTNTITATVTYTGVIMTQFGVWAPVHWNNWPNWGIAGTATAVVSTQSYIEFDLLLDNSGSMLIAANPADIDRMDTLTPCSTQSANEGQSIDGAYSWVYNTTSNNNNSSTVAKYSSNYIPYGYGTYGYKATSGPNNGNTVYVNEILPSTTTQQGACNAGFTGPSSGAFNECPYIPGAKLGSDTILSPNGYGQCVNSSGVPTGGGPGSYVSGTSPSTTTTSVNNVPQAPCAFACHNVAVASGQTYSNDYYGVARSNNIPLRFDTVQSAASQVIQSLINYLPTSTTANPFSVGVYTFNTGLNTIYTPPAQSSITTIAQETAELNSALNAVTSFQTPVTDDVPDTDFPDSMTSLYNIVSQENLSQNVPPGTSVSNPQRNLFIVTDGVLDYQSGSTRYLGGFPSSACQQFKALGFTVYVLYTTYYPLPNNFYLGYVKSYTEPTNSSTVAKDLQACATSASTFFQATNATQIQTAMQQMLQAALTTAGRLSQ